MTSAGCSNARTATSEASSSESWGFSGKAATSASGTWSNKCLSMERSHTKQPMRYGHFPELAKGVNCSNCA
jgi:hypothetical protein